MKIAAWRFWARNSGQHPTLGAAHLFPFGNPSGGGGWEPLGCLATRKLGYIRIGCDTNEASRAITLGPHAHGRVQLDWCEVLVTLCTWPVFLP